MKRLTFLILAFLVRFHAEAATLQEELAGILEKTHHPTNVAEFKTAPHLPPINQGKTLICWSVATSSFFESEMMRLGMEPQRLSVCFPVYCAYLEKTKSFVSTRGNSRFAPGDLFVTALNVYRSYGAVPAALYDKLQGNTLLDQTDLYAALESKVNQAKQQGSWNESKLLSSIKTVLNKKLGAVPERFSLEQKQFTPKSFSDAVVRLPWSEYVMVTSFESAPFYQNTALDVPDNWSRSSKFFNVPLPVFYESLKQALQNGFSASVDMDISEFSYRESGRYCIAMESDIPSKSIDQSARELRFQNGATSDDHLIHMIGFKCFDGEDWFVAKDSWKRAWKDGNSGFIFLHGSYVKLKVLAYMVHRDGIPQIKERLSGTSER